MQLHYCTIDVQYIVYAQGILLSLTGASYIHTRQTSHCYCILYSSPWIE